MAEFSDATMRPLLSVQAASGAGGLDLNTATADELDQALPRIGPAKAAAIIAWRDAHGGFTSVDQLGQVDGIGGKTLESLRPYVRVAAPPPPSAGQPADGVTQNANASPGSAAGIATQPLAQGAAAAQPQGLMAQTSTRTTAQPRAWTPEQITAAQQTLASGPININTANAEQLEQITGVGPVLAQRIIAYRHQYGPFRNLRDLRRVKGIGEQTLLKMLPEITVGQ
jgi:competence protein ComEA